MAYRALLLGNAVFNEDSGLPCLKGPPNDLSILREALTHPELGLHEAQNVESHLDKTEPEMREILDGFFAQGQRGDQLLFYYSGHGIRDNLNNLYLCGRNSNRKKPGATALPDVLINTFIQQSASRLVIIILDCCYSGSFKGSDDEIPASLATGRFVITSSRRSELSDDAGKDGDASVFTKCLVDALLNTDADADGDGKITLAEVYNYLLPKLTEVSKQKPQQKWDNTVDIPWMSRAKPRLRPFADPLPQREPELRVSETEVSIRGVRLGEVLPVETIDVLERNGGAIEWTVESSEPWIGVNRRAGFFELELKPPRVGTNRGIIYVRAVGRGGTQKIRVAVEVEEPVVLPLAVEPAALDFGTLTVGRTGARRTITTRNSRGSLQAACDDPRVSVRVLGELIDVTAAATAPGPRISSTIQITSTGGAAIVPVKAVIEGGPVLVVEPKILDFGEVVRGTAAGGTLAVRNGGSGKLSWQCTIDSGIFFDVEPAEDRVAVSLREASEGTYHGSIRIKSNGGEATVDVRARVVPPRQSNLIQPPVTEAAVGPGQWQIDVVAFGVPQAQLVATFLPNGALAGMQQALGMNVPIQGRWVYDIAQRQLGLEVYGPGFGDVVVIQIVGQQGNVLQGHNGRGFTYVLTSLA